MKSPRKSSNYLQLYPTQEEKEDIEHLFSSLKISSHRKSEVFIHFIIEGLKSLSKSQDNPYTQTNQQYNDKELKVECLVKIKGFISETPKTFKQVFSYFFQVYAEQFGTPRTRMQWLKHLFEGEEFLILDLKSQLGDYYVIPARSFFHAQFKLHCFKFPHQRINYQPTSVSKAKEKIYNLLNFDYHISAPLDKIEQFALKVFVAHLEKDEKPMINDLVIKEGIQLRSEWKHQEAEDLLKQEKEFREKQKNKPAPTRKDNGMQFLEALER